MHSNFRTREWVWFEKLEIVEMCLLSMENFEAVELIMRFMTKGIGAIPEFFEAYSLSIHLIKGSTIDAPKVTSKKTRNTL